jgi:hypothetical protein
MGKTLKQQNRPQLVVFLAVNVIGIGAALFGLNAAATLFAEFLHGNFANLGRVIVLPAMSALVLGIISWLLPAALKETVVFWRVGPRRLPSSKAFTVIAPADPRIDMSKLSARLGKLPAEPETQNALWYAAYRKHGKEPAVIDAHGAYLLYREMTALVPFIACITFGLAIAAPVARNNLVVVGSLLLLEYLVLMLATRNAGARLVGNVLAVEAAISGKKGSPATEKPRSTKAPKAG